MNTNPDDTSAMPAGSGDLQSLQLIARHQRRLKWLTGAAIGFWALAVLGSVGLLICYSLFVAPKEKQLFADYGLRARAAGPQVPGHSTLTTDQAVGVNFTMIYVATKGVIIVAISVIVLSCGTLATLILVVMNRRVTLQQINFSLAQISSQLKTLSRG